MIGKIISHYKILEKLGSGGMGTVYKAQDTKLDRFVALKFLPPHLSQDEENKKRFIHEAKAASALNHPNIATIYEIDEADGQMFIAMEYIEGRDLKSMIDDGPRTMDDALDYAIQITEGLAKAHRKGIIHRDIKPANILVTEDGVAKIVDFGLAKLAGRTQLTKEGTSMGTVAYMSPEQAQGTEVDHRSDIWALGAAIYEMITGKQPFAGDFEQAVIYSIINEDPEPLTALRTGVPMELERIVLKALAKDPDERYQHVDEMNVDLKAMANQIRVKPGRSRRDTRTPRPFLNIRNVILGGTIGTALLLLWFWTPFMPTEEPDRDLIRPISVELRQVTFSEQLEEDPVFSPDGSQIAFCREIDGFMQIMVSDIQSGSERQLTSGPVDNIQPAWSLDGRTLLFVRANEPSGKVRLSDIFESHDYGDIWKIDLPTGKETRLIQDAFNPAFSPDGKWFAFDANTRAGSRCIWKADPFGRNVQQLSSGPSEAVYHIKPAWSPDGSKIVFQNVEKTKFDIKVVDVATKALTAVTDDSYRDIDPAWSQSGNAIYFSSYRSGGMNIWRIAISRDGRPVGQPQQVTTGAGQDVQLALSADGRQLAFSVLNLNADIWAVPVDPNSGRVTGEPRALIASTREESRGAWSPDGTTIAFNSNRNIDMNIWLYGFADGSVRQLTTGPGGDYQPNWSPDGKQITFFSSRAGNPDIWLVEVASGKLRQLTKDRSMQMNPFFSPDGKLIAYESDEGGRREVWIMNADGSKQRKLTEVGVTTHYMRWSLDGHDIYFRLRAPEEGAKEIWRVPREGGEAVPFTFGGYHMSFSPDQSWLADNNHKEILLTNVATGERMPVFEFADPAIAIDYSVWSPDGKWILFDRLKQQGGDIWVMENFE